MNQSVYPLCRMARKDIQEHTFIRAHSDHGLLARSSLFGYLLQAGSLCFEVVFPSGGRPHHIAPSDIGRSRDTLPRDPALHEAIEAIKEAEAVAEISEDRHWRAELYRLCGVFLAAIGGEETQIETSFQQAINTAKEQKSVSLAKRAEASYAEYRREKASESLGRGFGLPLL